MRQLLNYITNQHVTHERPDPVRHGGLILVNVNKNVMSLAMILTHNALLTDLEIHDLD